MNLHPRTFTSNDLATYGWAVTIDPSSYTASVLMAQVADGWLIHTRNAGNTTSTIINRASIIRSLGNFLTDPGDRHLSLETTSSALLRRLVDWERHLIVEHGAESGHSKRASATLRQYVMAYLVNKSIDNPLARRWATSKAIRYGDDASQSIPLDEFSNKERISIEQKFREVVRSGERLQDIGSSLLTKGEDPRSAGWDSIPNLVWAFHHISLDDIPTHVWSLKSPDDWWALLHDMAPETAQLRPLVFGHPLMGLVIPNLYHIQALRCLVLLRTGWPPEEVLQLKNDDVEFGDTAVRVATRKNRASKFFHRELSSTARDDAKGWNPGDLLRRAADAMRPANKHVTGNPDFWLGALARPHRRRSKDLPAWLSTLPMSRQYGFGQLLKRTNLTVSTPSDVRRLRKTHKSAKAALLGTLAGSAGDDHSIEVFRTHYAQSTTVHTIAAQTVLNAQALVMDHIGPTVVLGSAAQTAAMHPANQIGSAATATVQESPTDATLSISSCTDPTNPPHSSAPQCLDAPQMCLTCTNAVIFEDHVPRLVAYRQILKDLEPEMAPQQFAALYGQQITNIEAVLQQFPGDLVDSAKNAPSPIRVPLTMRKGR